MIELNETNCTEMTAEEFEAKAMELAGKEIKKAEKEQRKYDWKSEEGRAFGLKVSNLKKAYLENYGAEALAQLINGKASSFGKLHKMKGCGYGNM